jgi:hypothetical protein
VKLAIHLHLVPKYAWSYTSTPSYHYGLHGGTINSALKERGEVEVVKFQMYVEMKLG